HHRIRERHGIVPAKRSIIRRRRSASVPSMFLDGRAISDSTRIIVALEERYKQPPLYPREPALRKRALELEDDLDETFGPALRASIITPIFRKDRDLALRLLTTGMPDGAYRRLGQRFHGSNHIRQARRACRTRCG